MTKKIIKYIVINEYGFEPFQTKVQQWIDVGYVPQGGVSTVLLPSGFTDVKDFLNNPLDLQKHQQAMLYSQALIFYEEQDDRLPISNQKGDEN